MQKPCPDLKDLATGQGGNSDRLGGRTSEANEKVKEKEKGKCLSTIYINSFCKFTKKSNFKLINVTQ